MRNWRSGRTVALVVLTAWAFWLWSKKNHAWVLYDQFRDFWGAASILCGQQIPSAGGAAAGLNVASPLHSWLLSLPLSLFFSEQSAGVFVLCVVLVAVLSAALSWYRSEDDRIWYLLLLITSWYRVFDLHSSMDQIILVSVILIFAIFLPRLERTKSLSALALCGLAIGIAPHSHASGIFVVMAGLVLLWENRSHWTDRSKVVFFLSLMLPLSYWLTMPVAVDQGRGFPFLLNPLELAQNLQRIFFNTLSLDRYWLHMVGVNGLSAWLYRMPLLFIWAVLLFRIWRIRHWRFLLLVGSFLVINGRSDYVLGTQYFVWCVLLLSLSPKILLPRWQKGLMGILILCQMTLSLMAFQKVDQDNFYRMPLLYFTLANPVLSVGTELSVLEIPDTVLRSQIYQKARQENRVPLVTRGWPWSVDEIMAFSSTGMLSGEDLMTDRCGLAHQQPIGQPLPDPKAVRALREIVSFSRFSLAALIGSLTTERSGGSKDAMWRCTFGDFVFLNYCLDCYQSLLALNTPEHRQTLAMQCLPANIASGLAPSLPFITTRDVEQDVYASSVS